MNTEQEEGSFLHVSATNRASLFHDIRIEIKQIGRIDADLYLNAVRIS